MNKGGFSWKRFLGITKAKRSISRKTGIPLTKSGRQQKLGRIIYKECLGVVLSFAFSLMLIFTVFLLLL